PAWPALLRTTRKHRGRARRSANRQQPPETTTTRSRRRADTFSFLPHVDAETRGSERRHHDRLVRLAQLRMAEHHVMLADRFLQVANRRVRGVLSPHLHTPPPPRPP